MADEGRPVFSRLELVRIRKERERLGHAHCPRCEARMLEEPVAPRRAVSYVRRRRWLLCPTCGRSALIESPDRDARRTAPLRVVGWREWVALPELGIVRIKAKIDTGARTSTLHAIDLHETTRDGAPWLEFTVLPAQRSSTGAVRTGARVADEREVRSSSGEAQLRPVIVTTVTIGSLVIPAEFTLSQRDRMGFRMLIGRTTLRGHFVVDPAGSHLQPPDAADSTETDPLP